MVEASKLTPENNSLYLEIADRIGNALCRDAVWDQTRCSWLGWNQEVQGRRLTPVYRSCAADLYGGTSGIGLFLAELYQFTQDRQQLRAIEGAVNQALSLYVRLPSGIGHGFYAGRTGIAFSLIRIGEILQRDVLVERGFFLLNDLRDIPFDIKNIDVISGSAGAIPALLHLAEKYQREDLLEFSVKHGRHLLKLAEYGEYGCSWSTIGGAKKSNLTGHSHGTAGIATALLELYGATEEQEFLNAAQAAIKYENHWFEKKESNWVDLRKFAEAGAGSPSCSMAWCHGAPGIGLSRLRNRQLLAGMQDDAVIEQDLEAAIYASRNALLQLWVPGKLNYSLCHGAAGNAELMIMAARDLQRPELLKVADQVAQDGHTFYVRQGLPWPCGNGGAGESPGLMLGAAGIGYFYLRMYDAQRVPSILLVGID